LEVNLADFPTTGNLELEGETGRPHKGKIKFLWHRADCGHRTRPVLVILRMLPRGIESLPNFQPPSRWNLVLGIFFDLCLGHWSFPFLLLKIRVHPYFICLPRHNVPVRRSFTAKEDARRRMAEKSPSDFMPSWAFWWPQFPSA